MQKEKYKSNTAISMADFDRSINESFIDTIADITASDYSYIDIDKDWANVIKPIIDPEEVRAILNLDLDEHDVNQFYEAMEADERVNYEYGQDSMTQFWECSYWRNLTSEVPTAYDKCVCSRASDSSDSIVNTLLFNACEAYQDELWSIVGSDKPSTSWDGE